MAQSRRWVIILIVLVALVIVAGVYLLRRKPRPAGSAAVNPFAAADYVPPSATVTESVGKAVDPAGLEDVNPFAYKNPFKK
ncbi:MAG: hypothetical protein WAP74_03020 [Patescibacteria group bacterium]